MATYETLIVETRGRVGWIRFNRPQRMNALNDALAKELSAVLHAFDDDPEMGCIVITGNERAFAAGADIGAMAEWDYAKVAADDYITRDWEEIRRIRKPVIAAVAGFALGGGCELAMACDIIVAADTAKFGQPEIAIGTMPGMGGTQRLARQIAPGQALHLMITGEMVGPQRAAELGIVERLFPAESFWGDVMAYATKLAQGPSLAHGMIKLSVRQGLGGSLAEGLSYERANQSLLFLSHDAQEGIKAFLEKRKPAFQGK